MRNPAIKLHFVWCCASKRDKHEISLALPVPLIPCVHEMMHCGEPEYYSVSLFHLRTLRGSHDQDAMTHITHMNSGRWSKTL